MMVGQLIRLAIGHPSKPRNRIVDVDDDEEQAWRQKMLARHKANLRRLQEQLATYGTGEQPLHLLNQIVVEEEAIERYSRM